MKTFKQSFKITLPSKQAYMDLTDDIVACVRRANIRDGICTVNTLHITSAVATTSNDPEVLNSYLNFYEKVTDLVGEEHRAALSHQLVGNGLTLPVIDGELSLGVTQYIMYFDFDGGREKNVEIFIMGE